MATALVVGRLFLAAVFVAAGAAKVRDLPGSRRAVAEFGVPAGLAAALGTLLPLVELTVAGALLAHRTARWGALSALALLMLFCVAIVWNLRRGRAPDCHCFGQLHSSPASGRTVARNLALALVAFSLAVGLGAVAPAVAFAAVGGAALLGGLALVPPRREREPVSGGADPAALEGLPAGTPAPAFRLPGLGGVSHTLDSLRADGRPVLLIFSDPNCGPCIEMAPEVARWQREHSDELTIAVISRDVDDHGPTDADEHGRCNVLLQREFEVADAYGAHGTPTGVLVGRDGAIASAVAAGGKEIEALVVSTVDGLPPRPANALPARPVLGRPLRRRELLVRAAGAWAATSVVLAWPLRAVAGSRARRRCRTDRDCGSKQKCRGQGQDKFCTCTSNVLSDECGRDCTNINFDDKNCGGCGSECIPGRTCVNGDCVPGDTRASNCRQSDDVSAEPGCPPGSVCCGEPTEQEGVRALLCKDLKRDKNHCGRCNRACTQGKKPTCCYGNCRDVDGDPSNCGTCLNRCPADKPICSGGKCREKCPQGLRRCAGTCYQPSTELCCKGRVYQKEQVQGNEDCSYPCSSRCRLDEDVAQRAGQKYGRCCRDGGCSAFLCP